MRAIHYHTNPCANKTLIFTGTENLSEVTCKTCIRILNSSPARPKSKEANRDIIESRKFNEAIKLKKKTVTCLRCDRSFISLGNRICEKCKNNKTWGEQLEGHSLLL